jgi:hypothetical protein
MTSLDVARAALSEVRLFNVMRLALTPSPCLQCIDSSTSFVYGLVIKRRGRCRIQKEVLTTPFSTHPTPSLLLLSSLLQIFICQSHLCGSFAVHQEFELHWKLCDRERAVVVLDANTGRRLEDIDAVLGGRVVKQVGADRQLDARNRDVVTDGTKKGPPLLEALVRWNAVVDPSLSSG